MSRRRSLSRPSSIKREVNLLASPLKSPSKYRAQKIEVDGLRFDSKKEAQRYQELKLMQRAGVITNLKVHPSFDFKVNDLLVCKYTADFSYSDHSMDPAMHVVEDVKGVRKGGAWEKFRIKAKLFRALFGYDITVI